MEEHSISQGKWVRYIVVTGRLEQETCSRVDTPNHSRGSVSRARDVLLLSKSFPEERCLLKARAVSS